MNARDQLLGLIDALYAAPGSAERWQSFLEALCTALDGTAASFISHNLSSQEADISLIARTDPVVIGAYAAHWGRLDPWVHSPKARLLTTGRVGAGEELIAHNDLRRTEYYNDFATHYDLTQALAGMIEAGPNGLSFLSINASESRARFAEEEVALLRALMPHLQRALQIHRRVTRSEAVADRSMAALDHLGHAVLLLDAGGRPMHVNRAAEHLLRGRDGLTLEQHELRAANPRDTTMLRQMIAGAIETSLGNGTSSGGVLVLGRPSGRRPLRVVVAPVAANRVLFGPEPAGAIVFVTDPERSVLLSEHEIRTLFRLTPAEAKLTRLLAEGVTLSDAAIRLGLRAQTVRTRLKTIFEKTNTHRQTDLVRLVLNATPRL
ncbi:MAG TPA: LuxR C-terminal-related transcriptional regulator [Vicinamibacterales bacterium]|nr:LuxR C-terminal-related transcriptional regulator [Vicinamibacterales bacterium]